MAAITYTAVDRGTLVTSTSPDHSAGTEYSIDVKLRAWTENIETPKTQHVSIAGNTETVLRRATNTYNATLIWPHTQNEDMQEFLYSVAGGEIFIIDPYGNVGDSPGAAISVVSMNEGFAIGRLNHGEQHWRSVSMTLRRVVVE